MMVNTLNQNYDDDGGGGGNNNSNKKTKEYKPFILL